MDRTPFHLIIDELWVDVVEELWVDEVQEFLQADFDPAQCCVSSLAFYSDWVGVWPSY